LDLKITYKCRPRCLKVCNNIFKAWKYYELIRGDGYPYLLHTFRYHALIPQNTIDFNKYAKLQIQNILKIKKSYKINIWILYFLLGKFLASLNTEAYESQTHPMVASRNMILLSQLSRSSPSFSPSTMSCWSALATNSALALEVLASDPKGGGSCSSSEDSSKASDMKPWLVAP